MQRLNADITTERRIEEYLRPLGITQPVRQFITLVSNVYHHFESQLYDDSQLGVYEASHYWHAILNEIAPELPPSVHALDLGAGTGFASEQVLKVLGGRVTRLVCQDLSPDMLAQCRSRIDLLTAHASYVSGDLEALSQGSGRFDLVVTNAMLHHLIDVPAFLENVSRLVRPGGFYVAGHEPSRGFYADEKVSRWTKRYHVWKRLRRVTSTQPYLRRLGMITVPKSLEELTNDKLITMGAIGRPLPQGVIPKLVDIHVPPLSQGTPFWGEYGFDAEDLCRNYLEGFELYSLITYLHIKDVRSQMDFVWRAIDRRLAEKYPTSGANFLMAARRIQ